MIVVLTNSSKAVFANFRKNGVKDFQHCTHYLVCTVLALLASNIGPMLAQYCAQYWDNIGHNIALILAALHNDNIGQYC